ncbi:MAG TPA: maleylpyruvate isomerase N-terminal domain-containing protein [Acidimicrobiales bacterium]|nr:maleylpyruvate isomerase N-terminal domain-containing protein [Acidimicrobiales bacterium]
MVEDAVPAIDLRPAASRLGALIETVPEADLVRATPCSEYCVGDLLDHMQGLTVAFGGAAVKADGPSSTMGPSGTAANLDAD